MKLTNWMIVTMMIFADPRKSISRRTQRASICDRDSGSGWTEAAVYDTSAL